MQAHHTETATDPQLREEAEKENNTASDVAPFLIAGAFNRASTGSLKSSPLIM